ncbi:30S ribosomal protein S4e [Candidatus Woesearchaeota archaeon]|jgi:small subunit ribosomal protein S4e|nr:30S ribosomal protein S4e [Candidatus Woesearchaeota archaeon]
MVKNHLKSISAPKTWRIERKKTKFITRPKPGAHKLEYGISLSLLMREMIKVAKTSKEVKYILNHKDVIVDGKKRVDPRVPVGLMDVVYFPSLNLAYRMSLDEKGKLAAVKVDEKEANIKICRILNKRWVNVSTKDKKRATKMQFCLSDGRNLLLEKDNSEYKTGDSFLLRTPSQDIAEHLKFEKGVPVFLIGGRHAGQVGLIEEIMEKKILFKSKTNQIYETSKEYAVVIGKKQPLVTLIQK